MSYSHEPHAPTKRRNLPWMVCRYCGLVYLHNEPTAAAIRLGCNWKDHPTVIAERANRPRVAQPKVQAPLTWPRTQPPCDPPRS